MAEMDETRLEQIARLKRELLELKQRHPLNVQDQARLLEILDEMDELRDTLDATLRAARLPPLPPKDENERLN
jgi:small-conductance mechanosensitive channel